MLRAIFHSFPTTPGHLPKWLLLVSVTSAFNTLQTYLAPEKRITRRVYARDPKAVTPLASRLFGTWTLTSAVVRAYGAYHIHEKAVYELCIATFLIALGHFVSEMTVYRSARPAGIAAISPLFVASLSLYWMFSSYDYYVKPAGILAY